MSDEINDRLEAIKVSLAAAVPHRIATRSFRDAQARKPDELKKGIYTLISNGEKGYKNFGGRRAKDGTHHMLLIGQCKVDGKADPVEIDIAEGAMAQEVKEWLRDLPMPLACLVATGMHQSAQMDYPYAWVSFDLEMDT